MKKLSFFLAIIVFLLLSCNLMSSSGGEGPSPTAQTFVITVVSSPTAEAATPSSESTSAPTAAVPTVVPPAILPTVTLSDRAVFLVEEGDVLNVRSDAGVSKPILYTIPPLANNIIQTQQFKNVGSSTWVKVALPGKQAGWVNNWYLTPTKTSAEFCGDAEVDILLSNFIDAVVSQKGNKLKTLVSKTHGLIARHEWWNTEVQYPFGNIQNIFTDATILDWGFADGSGLPIKASFNDSILQAITDDLLETPFQSQCNQIIAGQTAGYVKWPYEYSNINYYSYHTAGSPKYDGMDWTTWVFGIEYIMGKPYVVIIINYHWEI